MGHFKIVYQGFPIDLPTHEPVIALKASSGSFPGQALGDFVTLELNVRHPEFFFDPHNDPEGDFATRLSPYLDTQWLEIPIKFFKNRDYKSLGEIDIDFKGEGTPNKLKKEDWWEAPGLITTYSDELFKRAEISLRGASERDFHAHIVGETVLGTSFDIAFDAPLTIKLVSYRNSYTTDQLLTWFDTFLKKDDFVFNEMQRGEDLYISGSVR